ncbi:MAG: DUF4294 domain-containing protein [Flavobacteriaceae bacterium]|nr:DUF4294 domain-containing protein [Flavobacteriaceae bacterium]
MSIFIGMKNGLLLCALLTTFLGFSQEKKLVPVPDIQHQIIIDGDTIQEYSIPEIYIGFDNKEIQYKKDMNILRNRIRRVYPYAKATADNLMILNSNLEKMKTNREKRVYIKRAQAYLEEQFKERLKKLSRNDGKILIKLIHRETGQTTYQLIKEFRSGWTAFWSNTTARTFSLNLKSEYHPDEDLNDFYIETQLQYLFFRYELQQSNGKPAIKFKDLAKQWEAKVKDTEFFPSELRE